jgi:hypothetical protein
MVEHPYWVMSCLSYAWGLAAKAYTKLFFQDEAFDYIALLFPSL